MPECSAQAVGTSVTCVYLFCFFSVLLAHISGFDCLLTKEIVEKVAHKEGGVKLDVLKKPNTSMTQVENGS